MFVRCRTTPPSYNYNLVAGLLQLNNSFARKSSHTAINLAFELLQFSELGEYHCHAIYIPEFRMLCGSTCDFRIVLTVVFTLWPLSFKRVQ